MFSGNASVFLELLPATFLLIEGEKGFCEAIA